MDPTTALRLSLVKAEAHVGATVKLCRPTNLFVLPIGQLRRSPCERLHGSATQNQLAHENFTLMYVVARVRSLTSNVTSSGGARRQIACVQFTDKLDVEDPQPACLP